MHSNIIFVSDLIAEIQIGVNDDEKGRTQRVRINVHAEPEIWPDPSRDNIEDTVSYAVIVDHIFRLTKDRHIHLVETLAEEIASACFTEKIRSVKVRVEKLDIFPFTIPGVEIIRTKA
jgi:7,8-dihydroneopterin aldolase/epimerase/oxygenase